jgi:DNA polymerase-1
MIHYIGNELFMSSEFTCGKTAQDVLDYFKDIPSIMVDTETTGLDCHKNKIILLQIGTESEQFVIDCRYVDIKLFKDLIESKVCLLHNAKFDYKFLKKEGIILNKVVDTMIYEQCLTNGLDNSSSLAACYQKYLGITLDKSQQSSFINFNGCLTESQVIYAGKDVEKLRLIALKQYKHIVHYELQECVRIECEVLKSFGDIEYNGMYLNAEKWLKNTADYKVHKKTLLEEMNAILLNDVKLSKVYKPKYIQADLFGAKKRELNVNYDSPLQIKKIFKVLGFTVESTGEKEIKKVKNKHKFFELLDTYREVSKVISTYGEKFVNNINPETNRIHTIFWQIKETFRVSSGEKDSPYINVQNIPADNKFRNCFESRPGYSWVSVDFSAQELRLMADMSDETNFLDILNKGEDLHCYVGSLLTGKTITKADKVERNKAKSINFMKPYGGGPTKLVELAGVSLQEAEQLFKVYAEKFPNLEKWLKNQASFAKRYGYIRLPKPHYGIRWFPDMTVAKRLRMEEPKNWKEIFKIEGATERAGMNTSKMYGRCKLRAYMRTG